jgi:hypothetical protein
MSDSISKLDTLARLVQQIQQTHQELSAQASKAVNVSLTLRNWLIGLYITEYEQQGKDRAEYGASCRVRRVVTRSIVERARSTANSPH